MNFIFLSSTENVLSKQNSERAFSNLLKLSDSFIIERIIRIATNNGAKKIFWILEEQKGYLIEFLNSNNFNADITVMLKNKINHVKELFEIIPHLSEEPVCISAFNSIFKENEFSEFLNYSLLQEDTDGIIAVTRDINIENPLCTAMDEQDRIIKFSDSQEGYNWKSGGIYFFYPRILNEFEATTNMETSTMNNFLRQLIYKGYILKGFSFSNILLIS